MDPTESTQVALQIQDISKAILRERALVSRLRELQAESDAVQRRQITAQEELAAVRQVLRANPELTTVARQLIEQISAREDDAVPVTIENPKYVSSKDKRKLLATILRHPQDAHPGADSMPYSAIREVLRDRYGITTNSAGLFFRKELKEWATRGGNKNKQVVLDKDKLSPMPLN